MYALLPGEHEPFLQWLPGRKPQVIGTKFADHIDLDFVVDEEDEYKAHRALRLINLKPEFSGSYKCKVSTFEDEDFKQNSMVIFCKSTWDFSLKLFSSLFSARGLKLTRCLICMRGCLYVSTYVRTYDEEWNQKHSTSRSNWTLDRTF